MLSQLSFLVFPILGIILPLIIWISKKTEHNQLNEIGKSIINFQGTWFILTFSILGILSYLKIAHIYSFSLVGFLLLAVSFYTFNISMILFNYFRITKGIRSSYFPQLKLI